MSAPRCQCQYCQADDHSGSAAFEQGRAAAVEIDVVFDGPPGPIAGRFVECESPPGVGVHAGEWIERTDGYWALRIRALAAARGGENDAATGAGDASVEGALDHPERSHQAATPSLTPNERAAAPHLHYPYGWDAACAECCREKSAFGRAAAPRGETP